LVVAVLWILDTNPSLGAPRNYYPTVFVVARAGYAMVAARAAFALLFRNRSWWWVAYAVLLFAVEPLVTESLRSASDGWR
jgi:hypothetical protein